MTHVFVALAVILLALRGVSTANEATPEREAIARKLGYPEWDRFFRAVNGSGYDKLDFSILTPAERTLLMESAQAEDNRYKHWAATNPSGSGIRDPFRGPLLILLKLKDPAALDYIRHQFKKGYLWAADAGEACARAGEAALIPLAAETLFTERPEKEFKQTGCVSFRPHPNLPSAQAIQGILIVSKRFPQHVRDDAQRLSREPQSDILSIYQSWWRANGDQIIAQHYNEVSSPKK